MGLQFHPEATETIVTMWSSGDGVDELAGQGIKAEDLMSATRANQADSEERCDALVDWFLRTIAQGHMPQG
jgi:hypothetical protein